MRNAYRSIMEHADQMTQLIDELGDSLETRIAKARIDETVLWADRHITVHENRRDNEAKIRSLFMDLFDRIAAAIAAKQQGGPTDNPTYDAHLTALDQELSDLKGTESGDETRISAIEAGLSKIADAVNPPPPAQTGSSETTPPSSDTATPAPSEAATPAAPQSTAPAAATTPAPSSADATATPPTSTGSVDTTAQGDTTAAPAADTTSSDQSATPSDTASAAPASDPTASGTATPPSDPTAQGTAPQS